MSAIHPKSGVIPLLKPPGITSFDVIRQIKRSIPIKKMGHGGTLDRLAGGVLPLLIGEATKCFDYIRQGKKIYVAQAQFGKSTDTDDADGQIIQDTGLLPIERDIAQILPDFIGNIEQIPPTYSALKVGGKRSSDLARDNKVTELKPRNVVVHDITIDEFNPQTGMLKMTIICETGTYIRSIVRDLGEKLGTGAYLSGLTRTRSGGFDMKDCVPVNEIDSENWGNYVISLNDALHFIPSLSLKDKKEYLLNGKPLKYDLFDQEPTQYGTYRVIKDNQLIALVSFQNGKYQYLRVFHE